MSVIFKLLHVSTKNLIDILITVSSKILLYILENGVTRDF